MKVGIVVPYSWSFWGGVVEHAEEQASALGALGIETRTLIGHDPPGAFSLWLHPRSGRQDHPGADVIPVGRTVIVPGNGSLPNLVLSPSAIPRIRRTLRRERFDLLHVHEPMTPAVGVAAMAMATCSVVATFHAAGESSWRKHAIRLWGFLLDRIDKRIAVSGPARSTAEAYAPGDYEIIPNGVRIPTGVRLDGRRNTVVFVGRHEPRKGLAVLLRAWPHVFRASGSRLRLIGADPLAVRLLATRHHLQLDGVDILGPLPRQTLAHEIATAKVLVAPSTSSESFGMVITKAFAHGTPVIASNIDGYRDIVSLGGGTLVPPGKSKALADAVNALLANEAQRRSMGNDAHTLARDRYAWPTIANTLADRYQHLLDNDPSPTRSPGSRVPDLREETI